MCQTNVFCAIKVMITSFGLIFKHHNLMFSLFFYLILRKLIYSNTIPIELKINVNIKVLDGYFLVANFLQNPKNRNKIHIKSYHYLQRDTLVYQEHLLRSAG